MVDKVSALTEVFINSVFDLSAAVLFPILTLVYCYYNFDFDREVFLTYLEKLPVGSFEHNARSFADPSEIALFRVNFDSLRISSLLDFTLRISMNLALCFRFERVLQALIRSRYREYASRGVKRTVRKVSTPAHQNPLEEWPEELRKCRGIKTIQLIYTDNRLVPEWAKEFKSLETIQIEGKYESQNLLKLPEDLFINLPQLLNPQVQEGFVRTAVAPDVHYGTVQGVEALLENWRYLSLGFKGIEIQLDRLESGTDGSVVATSTTMFTITENTLRVVFPHLLDDEENGKLHPIGAKLLGQQVHVKALTEFNWDGERGCMTSIHMTPDLFTPLLRILGSLEDVAHVFSNARMTSECKAIN
ncbi:uncharacterized protein IUM83_01323 [Phytophthora cinnamomi]|uniref:uncharacterized protein n=1 Tax=Phytophthora cinnamomi TaxID=4785 RepID=UPI00355A301A|nr:putative membrane protein [Phytophthora cinnamomi]